MKCLKTIISKGLCLYINKLCHSRTIYKFNQALLKQLENVVVLDVNLLSFLWNIGLLLIWMLYNTMGPSYICCRSCNILLNQIYWQVALVQNLCISTSIVERDIVGTLFLEFLRNNCRTKIKSITRSRISIIYRTWPIWISMSNQLNFRWMMKIKNILDHETPLW